MFNVHMVFAFLPKEKEQMDELELHSGLTEKWTTMK